jgi:hypothetical protein
MLKLFTAYAAASVKCSIAAAVSSCSRHMFSYARRHKNSRCPCLLCFTHQSASVILPRCESTNRMRQFFFNVHWRIPGFCWGLMPQMALIDPTHSLESTELRYSPFSPIQGTVDQLQVDTDTSTGSRIAAILNPRHLRSLARPQMFF